MAARYDQGTVPVALQYGQLQSIPLYTSPGQLRWATWPGHGHGQIDHRQRWGYNTHYGNPVVRAKVV